MEEVLLGQTCPRTGSSERDDMHETEAVDVVSLLLLLHLLLLFLSPLRPPAAALRHLHNNSSMQQDRH